MNDKLKFQSHLITIVIVLFVIIGIVGWKASQYLDMPWDPEVTGADAFADYGYTGSKTGLASAAIPGAQVNPGDIYSGPFKDWVWEPYRQRQSVKFSSP
jgi:hypothetical protein